MKITNIEAFDLNDAWYQCIRKCWNEGYRYKIEHGSHESEDRCEFDFVVVHITNPGHRPLFQILPQGMEGLVPCDEEYIQKYYLEYIATDQKKPNEAYTYGSRICEELELPEAPLLTITAYERLISKYVNEGFDQNQCTLEIAQPSAIILDDPPCLRMIDTRIRYGKLHFVLYFRSWDLWGGFPTNLAAMQLLKEQMVKDINDQVEKKYGEEHGNIPELLEDGEMICLSKGLHIYSHAYKMAKTRLRIEE